MVISNGCQHYGPKLQVRLTEPQSVLAKTPGNKKTKLYHGECNEIEHQGAESKWVKKFQLMSTIGYRRPDTPS